MHQHVKSESELAPMLFALKMVMMQVMLLENEDEVERLQIGGFVASPDPRAPHSRRQFLGSGEGEDAEDESLGSRGLGTGEGGAGAKMDRSLPEASSQGVRGAWSGRGRGGEDSKPGELGEELRLLREMVLAEKQQAVEERRLAREERACAAEVRRGSGRRSAREREREGERERRRGEGERG